MCGESVVMEEGMNVRGKVITIMKMVVGCGSSASYGLSQNRHRHLNALYCLKRLGRHPGALYQVYPDMKRVVTHAIPAGKSVG